MWNAILTDFPIDMKDCKTVTTRSWADGIGDRLEAESWSVSPWYEVPDETANRPHEGEEREG